MDSLEFAKTALKFMIYQVVPEIEEVPDHKAKELVLWGETIIQNRFCDYIGLRLNKGARQLLIYDVQPNELERWDWNSPIDIFNF